MQHQITPRHSDSIVQVDVCRIIIIHACVFLAMTGTFQKVDYVFLVGTAGGVPHYTDYNKHVRLGDVVVSSPPDGQKYV